jgi:hypothetical protein
MNPPDIILAVQPVISSFKKLSIPYLIGGSIASSVYGLARATLDVDIVADFKIYNVSSFKEFLEKEYYIDETMIRDAIKRLASFNLIHLQTMIKIDVFIYQNRGYQKEAFQRKRKDTLEDSRDASEFYFSSAEDIILNKLQWYDMGNKISERQWLDVMGVIKVQGDSLDIEYLRKWGGNLGLLKLLRKAFKDSGIGF